MLTPKERHAAAKTLLAAAAKLEAGGRNVSAKAAKDSMDAALYDFTMKIAQVIRTVADKSDTLTSVKKTKISKDSGNDGNAVKGFGGTADNPIEWMVFVEPSKQNKFMRLRASYIIFKNGKRVRDSYIDFGSGEPFANIGRDTAAEIARLVKLAGE